MKSLEKLNQAVLLAAASVLSVPAFAQEGGVDYSPIVDAVDFGDIAPLVVAVGGGLAAIYVAIRGMRIGLSMLRGG